MFRDISRYGNDFENDNRKSGPKGGRPKGGSPEKTGNYKNLKTTKNLAKDTATLAATGTLLLIKIGTSSFSLLFSIYK